MNKHWISRYWWIPVIVAGTVLSSFTLFNQDEPGSVNPPSKKFKVIYAQLKDTLPGDKKTEEGDDWEFHIKTGEIDKAIAQMEKEMLKAKDEFKKIDFKKIEAEMQRALKEVKGTDLNKIKLELEQSLKSVEWDKMEKELKQSMKELEEIQLPKIKKELQEQLTKELAATEKELANTGKELELLSERLKGDIGKHLTETMKDLDKTLLEAKEQLKAFKQMTTEMEKDGLTKKGENADITFKKGELYINGKKQSKEISDKYRHYFKRGSFHFKIDDDDDWL